MCQGDRRKPQCSGKEPLTGQVGRLREGMWYLWGAGLILQLSPISCPSFIQIASWIWILLLHESPLGPVLPPGMGDARSLVLVGVMP